MEVTDRDTGANAQLQYTIESIDGIPCADDCVGYFMCSPVHTLFIINMYSTNMPRQCLVYISLLVL